ncbi:unnamed protein product, partial [Heterotrigona itama]
HEEIGAGKYIQVTTQISLGRANFTKDRAILRSSCHQIRNSFLNSWSLKALIDTPFLPMFLVLKSAIKLC